MHDLARAIHVHYDEYKNADPGAIGWALDRQIFEWVVPFHDGAVRYFKSIGVWTAAADQHNTGLVRRQQVLRDAWQAHIGSSDAGDVDAWYQRRAQALRAADLDPVWDHPGSG